MNVSGKVKNRKIHRILLKLFSGYGKHNIWALAFPTGNITKTWTNPNLEPLEPAIKTQFTVPVTREDVMEKKGYVRFSVMMWVQNKNSPKGKWNFYIRKNSEDHWTSILLRSHVPPLRILVFDILRRKVRNNKVIMRLISIFIGKYFGNDCFFTHIEITFFGSPMKGSYIKFDLVRVSPFSSAG